MPRNAPGRKEPLPDHAAPGQALTCRARPRSPSPPLRTRRRAVRARNGSSDTLTHLLDAGCEPLLRPDTPEKWSREALLLRGLGPWKESVFLVGGLTPRYLVAARPPEMPAHVGTFEQNLRAMGFERSRNERGQRLSWRWQTHTERGVLMVVELLADAPETEAFMPCMPCP